MNALETLLFVSTQPGVCLSYIPSEAEQNVIASVTVGCEETCSWARWPARSRAAPGHRRGMGYSDASKSSWLEVSRDHGLLFCKRPRGCTEEAGLTRGRPPGDGDPPQGSGTGSGEEPAIVLEKWHQNSGRVL